MKQNIFLLALLGLLLLAYPGFSKTTNAIVDGGNWTTAGTWDNGLPADGDVINIPTGITVVVNSNILSPVNLRGGGVTTLNVSGTISFQLGGMIRLDSGDGDAVNVLTGGSLVDGDGFGGSLAFGTNIFSGYFPFVYINNLFGFPTAGPINGPAVIQDGTLPVELVSFTAKVTDGQVELRWTTATELNNDFFSIERAIDVEHFEVIGKPIPGNGTTSERSEYLAFDTAPVYGRAYYRLKQTDYDGQFTYSNLVVVDYDGPKFSSLHIYPNPTSGGHFTAEIVGVKNQREIPLQIFDAQGRKVYETVISSSMPSAVKVDIEFNTPLQSGLYVIKAGQSLRLTRKLFVN